MAIEIVEVTGNAVKTNRTIILRVMRTRYQWLRGTERRLWVNLPRSMKISLMSLTNISFHQLPLVKSTIHTSFKEISVTLKTALLALKRWRNRDTFECIWWGEYTDCRKECTPLESLVTLQIHNILPWGKDKDCSLRCYL